MDKRKQVLTNVLQGKDPDMTKLAAEALELLQVREKLGALADTIESGEMLEKIRAICALSDLLGQDINDLLIKALKDPSEDVRAAVVRVMGSRKDLRVLSPLVEALKDSSPSVLRCVVVALGGFKDVRLLGPLMRMLKNEDAGVVELAIEAVGNIGDKRAEEAMIHFIAKGNVKMKSLAIKALGAMGI